MTKPKPSTKINPQQSRQIVGRRIRLLLKNIYFACLENARLGEWRVQSSGVINRTGKLKESPPIN